MKLVDDTLQGEFIKKGFLRFSTSDFNKFVFLELDCNLANRHQHLINLSTNFILEQHLKRSYHN